MQAHNVVEFNSAKAFSISLDELASFRGIKLVAKLIRQWERANKGNTYRHIARKAGLCDTTVARIASEETKAPRLLTILMIMKALGFSAVRFE